MRLWAGHACCLIALAVLTAACGQAGIVPGQSPSSASTPEISAAAAPTVQVTMPLDAGLTFDTFTGATQTVRGHNTSTYFDIAGTYVLTMNLDLTAIPPSNTSACPARPGRITWQPGLIASVQQQLVSGSGSGRLSIGYDKTTQSSNLHGSNVDSWVTTIGSYNYQVSFFRWATSAMVTNADGSVTVLYRGGSIEVFQNQGNTAVAREQCFGNYVNYDLRVR